MCVFWGVGRPTSQVGCFGSWSLCPLELLPSSRSAQSLAWLANGREALARSQGSHSTPFPGYVDLGILLECREGAWEPRKRGGNQLLATTQSAVGWSTRPGGSRSAGEGLLLCTPSWLHLAGGPLPSFCLRVSCTCELGSPRPSVSKGSGTPEGTVPHKHEACTALQVGVPGCPSPRQVRGTLASLRKETVRADHRLSSLFTV